MDTPGTVYMSIKMGENAANAGSRLIITEKREIKRYTVGGKHTLGDGCWGIRGLEDGGVYRIIIIGGLGGRRRREPEGEVLRGQGGEGKNLSKS